MVWVAITILSVSFGIVVIGVNYNLKKHEIPLWKVTLGNCEICFQASAQGTMGNFNPKCRDKEKSIPISEEYQKKPWKTIFQSAMMKIEASKKDDLLQLCCSKSPDDFIKNLYSINKDSLSKLISEIPDQKLRNLVAESVIEMLIFDSMGLEALNETIGQLKANQPNWPCSPQCCPSSTSSNQNSNEK